MAQEVRGFGTLRPEFDGEGECGHGLAVAANEGATEVYVFEGMLFGLEVGNLADVVAKGRKGC